MSDCRTCRHNSYLINAVCDDFVSCSHPITRAKEPRWAVGDPKMVDYRTGDVPVCEIHNLQDCPTYEAFVPDGKAPAKEGSAEEQSDGANSTIPREET